MTDSVQETTDPTLGQKIAAEALGTFVLVLFGVGAFIMSGGDYVATGLSFGLAVMVMAYAVGRISGGHFNPAVSLGAAVGGRIAWRQAGVYMVAQLGGAIIAGLALFILVHGFDGYQTSGNLGQNGFGDAGSGFAWWAAFLLELVMTALFIIVILAVTDVRNEHPSLAPMAIGLTLSVIHFASMGATGTSVNPARSIGPALFAGSDAILQLWLFILAPFLGALGAGALYHLMFGRADEPVPGSGLRFSRPVRQPAYPSDAYQQQWNQGYPQQWGAPQGYQQPYPPTGPAAPAAGAAWESQQGWTGGGAHAQGWEQPAQPAQQAWEQAAAAGQPEQPPASGDSWEGEAWEGQHAQWQQPAQPSQPVTQQPWTDPFPPAPSEPYWSQQLPENWNDTGPEADEDEGGHTQIRPPQGP